MKILCRDGATLIDNGHTLSIECKDAENKTVLMAVDHDVLQGYRTGILDADGAVFFQRQLEKIKAKSYDVKYAELKARSLFPVSNEGGDGVTTITYRTYDQVGATKIINAYAEDLPRADVSGKETTIPVRSLGNSYGYNIDEIRSAQLTGMPLDQRRANAARRSNEQKVNSIAFFGDAESGLVGFFTHPNIPQSSVVDPGTGTEWVNKTPDQILFDVNDAFADVFENTKMVERADTLCIPPSQWSYIMSTPRSSTSDTTIAMYLVQNSPYLTSIEDIIPLNECTATDNPEFSEDIMFVYRRDPDALQLEIPVEQEFMPVQHRNLEFVIPTRSRIGGLNVYYPLSANILVGI